MKIAIHSNDTTVSQQVVAQLKELCRIEQISEDDKNPDVVVSIGGDGTVLSAFHHYKHLVDHVQFVAIHTGHLGFYTDFLVEEVETLVSYLKNEIVPSYTYPMLQVSGLERQMDQPVYALNEITLKSFSGTLVCEVYIDDELFEVYRGDGLCVATPTGSTGVSKSLGGAIIHPCVEVMQLVEMAPLNNRVFRTIGSPLILPRSQKITFKIKSAGQPYVTIDNLAPLLLEQGEYPELVVSLAPCRVQFSGYKQIDFWTRVENSFIGEIDKPDMSETVWKKRYKIIEAEQ